MEPLRTIKIPEYITKVKTSESRRKKYYNKYSGKGVSRSYKDDDGNKIPIPKTYMAKVREGTWRFGPNGYLRDEDDERVVANPRSAGTPNYETLSGNKFMSGYGSPILRNKLVNALKDFYRPFVRAHVEEHGPLDEKYLPIHLEWDLYTTIDRNEFDLSNFFFYYKYFEDLLHETEHPETGEEYEPLIPDDSFQYITKPGGAPRLFPIDEWDKRGFVFRIYPETRKYIKEHPQWNKF